MKKVLIFTLIMVFQSNLVNSQCLSLSELTNVTTMDIEDQDKLLSSKGYSLTDNKYNLIESSIEWHNQESDVYINIIGGKDHFYNLQLRFKNSNCFESIREEMIKKGFKKDYEKNSKSNTLYFYYSSNDFGVILTKWKAPENYKGNFSNLVLFSKQDYLNELEKER